MEDHTDVSFLSESLNQLLEQDADKLNTVVESNIRALQSHLRQILWFLKQTERDEDKDLHKNLYRVVRNLEVIIHTLAVDTARYKMRSSLGKFLHFCSHKRMLCTTYVALQSVLKQIQHLNTGEQLFNGEDAENREAAAGRYFHGVHLSYIEGEQEAFGFQHKVESLVDLLTRGERRSQVVFIVGKSGTGKTTLAKKVYNLDEVTNHFDMHVWVNVSWNCSPGELLRNILEYARPTTGEKWDDVKDDILAGEVSKCFQQTKYLIVIDGLRGKDLWEKVNTAFPMEEGKESRILLITQTAEDVTGFKISLDDYGSISGQEYWKLLSRRIFNGRNIPEGNNELTKLGSDMAERCKALPPSTSLLLSGILARKVTSKAWSKVIEILKESEDDHESTRNKLLNHVYEKLPPHLSFCLLYFGMFRRGVEISTRQLIQLWMAEGFIQKKDAKNPEDLGEEYLQDLVRQSLIQVTARRTDGGVKACKINDVFHKFCISEGQHIKFFQPDHCSSPECWRSTRRLALHVQSAEEINISHFTNYHDIRSFQLSVQQHYAIHFGQGWNLIKRGFKLLRVLNLGYVPLHKMPNTIGELIHLLYLRVKSPKSKHVPPSICRLLNLQTLDLRESSLSSMPKGIWKMQRLRHLHLGYLSRLPEPQGAKNNALGSLQTLSIIRPTKAARHLMIKAKFPNVRRLGLRSRSKQETVEFLKSLDHLLHLESLKIKTTNIVSIGLPDPSAFPLTLTKISLSGTRLGAECIVKLERIPNLQTLKLLRNSLIGESIEWNAGGFPQLQVLQLVELELQTLKLGDRAMRNLQTLCIKSCTQLTSILPHTTWPRL